MKQIEQISKAPAKHWVGDGFYVSSMFSYRDTHRLIDPFLLLDYNPPHYFEPRSGQPRGVGAHPHRGFETVTIVYQGEVAHRDSHGGGGVIKAGDVQWMSAGAGILHEEFHSKEFSQTGGVFQVVQLWVNLPKAHKKTPPNYQAISAKDIPSMPIAEKCGHLRVIAGNFQGTKGPAHTFSPINLWDTTLSSEAIFHVNLPKNHHCLLLVLEGQLHLNDQEIIQEGELASFQKEGQNLHIQALKPAKFLLLSGEPLAEPVAGYGPFVMNTQEEIAQALRDYQNGHFGALSDNP
ncbi:pirin family protein [Helicobacter cynogastricus]|uniref:pirin family protein n=1 Tax=Helicobacter cynogastricus TaxID=329937 RepID=UPI000CF07DF8|nr:pirin family protein [Helicobacter cynogastricus]